jgi:hypothetical protein
VLVHRSACKSLLHVSSGCSSDDRRGVHMATRESCFRLMRVGRRIPWCPVWTAKSTCLDQRRM